MITRKALELQEINEHSKDQLISGKYNLTLF